MTQISTMPVLGTLPASGYFVPVVQSGVAVNYSFDLGAWQAALSASGGSALVGFQQSGTGAVSRTMQARLRDTISIKDFGAVGDGVADDTAAFNAAIAAYNSGSISAAIELPSGNYKNTSALTPVTRNGFALIGKGPRSSIIVPTTASSVLQLVSTSPTTTRISDCHLENFGIDYGSLAPLAGTALRISRADRLYVHNVDIRNAFQGVLIEGGADQHWSNLTLTGAAGWTGVATGSYLVKLANYSGSNEIPSEVFFGNINWKGATVGGNNYLERVLIIQCGDGVFFADGHLGFANLDQIWINAQANNQLSLLDINFDQIYVDGNSAGSALGKAIRVDGSTLPTVANIAFMDCALRNVMGDGYYGNLSTCTDTQLHLSTSNIAGTPVNIAAGNALVDSRCEFGGASNPVSGAALTSIASAATITVPSYGDCFTITGTTGISGLQYGWAGRTVTLLFAGALTVTHSTGSATAMRLSGAVNFTSTAGSSLTLRHNGTQWTEIGRAA